MIILLRKEKFGSSSEKTPAKQIDGQLSLFNEAEVEAASKPEEPIVQKWMVIIANHFEPSVQN